MLLIHSSMHKCLTMYYLRVMQRLLNWQPYRKRYEHLESLEGVFYNTVHQYKLVSVNGFAIDIDRLGDSWRISRFVRDPRDLIVSGYYYHKRGAEPWFRFTDPTDRYWQAINGKVPDSLKPGQSYSDYLNSVDLETGLIAEMQFRQYHFEALRNWPEHDNIKVFKYEDILGNETQTFQQLFQFYQFPKWQAALGSLIAKQLSANNQKNNKHIRNPQPNQWNGVFTATANEYFEQHYGDLIGKLGYK